MFLFPVKHPEHNTASRQQPLFESWQEYFLLPRLFRGKWSNLFGIEEISYYLTIFISI